MKKILSVCLCTLFVGSSACLADFIVASGYDLFETQPGTEFLGISFEGIPLGPYDFGGPPEIQETDFTDTTVERLEPAVVGGPGQTATVEIEIIALQLRSVDPVDLGAGTDFHYVTLQSTRGGQASTGMMDIEFDDENGGLFASFFEVHFDIRIGALNGPIIFSDWLGMTSSNNPWGRIPPPGAVIIPGVNHLLKGDGTVDQDFWPGTWPNGVNAGPIEHDASGAAHHIVDNPEPAAMVLLALGSLGVVRRKRMR